MHTLTRGERFKGARLDHNQHGKQTMDDVAAATGISKSLIQALEDDDNTRSVGYDKVAKLAAYYGVSANWLLSLSGDPHIQPTLADELGLSSSTIQKIKEIDNRHTLSGLNLLLDGSVNTSALYMMIDCLADVIKEEPGRVPSDFFPEHLSEDEKYIFRTHTDKFTKDILVRSSLHRELMEKYPFLVGSMSVIYGNELLAVRLNEICDCFRELVEEVTGYNAYINSTRGD